MEMLPVDRAILWASLLELKELHSELLSDGQLNSADGLKSLLFDRALRVDRCEYAKPNNPEPPRHFG
jgi:hypothetical protein